MAMIKVTIPEERFVPTLGKGPFRKPLMITEELYRMLKRMNYVVNVVNEEEQKNMEQVEAEAEGFDTQFTVGEEAKESTVVDPEEESDEDDTEGELVGEDATDSSEDEESDVELEEEGTEGESVEAYVEESAEEETEESEEEPELEEEPVEDAEEESVEEEIELTEEDEAYLMNSSTTKAKIQKFFTDKGIEFAASDTIPELLAKVDLKR